MAILEEDKIRVRSAVDLVEIVSEHVALKRVGRNWMGICPFHAEKSASFSVNAEIGHFRCFGCQKSGDVFTFVMETEHIDFVQAVERLAARANIELRYDNVAAAKERKQRSTYTDAMQRAVDWYHERLMSAPDAAAARAYLRERGYDRELVRRFQIGWAPAGWDELSRALKLPEHVLKGTGLGFVNRRGRTQDAFRERIMFPIFDSAGAPVAFGGRLLPGGEGPKYKNSSETPLYAKSRTLYALNWAKAEVVREGEVIVCEGYTDVIGFFQAGLPRAVATCGTALTEEHVRQLKNFATRIVIAYDADAAGQAAAARFYEWERKLGIDIAVAVFPKGMDPADAARRDPQSLRDAVSNAQPFLAFRLEHALSKADLRSIEGRARAAERCLEMVREHPNELVRDQYLMTVSDRCRVPVERLRTAVAGGPVTAQEIAPARVVDVRSARNDGPPPGEREALRMTVHEPEAVAHLLDRLAPSGTLAGLEELLFEDHRSRAAFRALTESPTMHDAIESAEPEASDLLSQLATEPVEEIEGQALETYVRLIDRAAQRWVRDLEVEARVTADGFAVVGPSLAWLKLTIERLRDSATSVEAAGALVSWMSEQQQTEPSR